MATEYLIRLGHRRILFIMRRGRRTIERRFEGWQHAMRQHGPFDTDGLVVEVEDWLPDLGAEAIMARIRRKGLDFTAILAAGGSLAVGAAIGLERLVSVMGMDDLPQAAFHTPPLTAMYIPMREIGAAALNLLLDDLGGFLMPPAPGGTRLSYRRAPVDRQAEARRGMSLRG